MRKVLLILPIAGVAVCIALVFLGSPAVPQAGQELPYPSDCAQLGLSQRRCDAIVGALAAQNGIDPSEMREIWLQRLPRGGTRGRFVPASGSSFDATIGCGGVGREYTILCSDEPLIQTASPIEGYGDIPCAGEPPGGCASPVPSAEPAAIAAARPLEVTEVVVPLDHVGAYSIPLGTAVLPNGVLSASLLELAETTQSGFLLQEGLVALQLWPTDGGERLDNRYAHGWRPGVEEVEARLVFTVDAFDPGAALHVRRAAIR